MGHSYDVPLLEIALNVSFQDLPLMRYDKTSMISFEFVMTQLRMEQRKVTADEEEVFEL